MCPESKAGILVDSEHREKECFLNCYYWGETCITKKYIILKHRINTSTTTKLQFHLDLIGIRFVLLLHRPRINQLKGKKGSCCPSIQKFSLVQGLREWKAALQETAVNTGGGMDANAQIHKCLPVYTAQNTVVLKVRFFSDGLGRWLSG